MSTILLLALVGLFFYWRTQINRLNQRLGLLETSFGDLQERLARTSSRPGTSGTATEPRGEAGSSAPEPIPPRPEQQPSGPGPGRPPAFSSESSDAPPSTPSEIATGQTPTATGPSLEESLGTRWAVYAGGLALALGAVFLVHYSIEQGLIGPGVRIALGFLLSAALIAGGERFRRGDRQVMSPYVPAAHIPSVLTAAGTVAAFATTYAAHALYGFVGPTLAFLMLGAIGVATMFAAALHGPALAGLGLVGAMVTPALISTTDPQPFALVTYLAVVAAAALSLARIRLWVWLAATTVAGAVSWGVIMLASAPGYVPAQATAPNDVWTIAAAAHGLLQMVLAAAVMAVLPYFSANQSEGQEEQPDWTALACLAGLSVLSLSVLAHVPSDHSIWQPFAYTTVVVLALTAWLSRPAAGAAVLSGFVAMAAAVMWPVAQDARALPVIDDISGGMLRTPDGVLAFLSFCFFATLPSAAAGALVLRRAPPRSIATAGLYALAATGVPLIMLVFAYIRATQFAGSVGFMSAGLLMAGAFAVLAEGFLRREDQAISAAGGETGVGTSSVALLAAAKLSTGAFSAAGVAALTLALAVLMHRGLVTSAFAITALVVANISTNRAIPILRHAVWVLGLVIAARLAWDPAIMGADVGRWPILNWLLVGYGVPALAFYQSAQTLRRTQGGRSPREDLATLVSEALWLMLLALLCYFQVRHLMHGGDVLAPGTGHVEQGLMTLVSLGLALLCFRLRERLESPVYAWAMLVFAGLATAFPALGLVAGANPYFSGERVVGQPILSSLALAYLGPAIMALYLARITRGRLAASPLPVGAAVLGLVLAFLYVTLEVRHLFQGSFIGFMRRTSSAEVWAYTVSWLGLGILFLGYGLWRHMILPRVASAVLIVGATAKVALFDLSGITGLWRALSFLCLGAILIGIGLVYQRWVFAKPPPAETGMGG